MKKYVLLMLLLFGACLHMASIQAAPKTTDRSKQKQSAEAQRKQVRKKLSTLKKEITKTETAKSKTANALAKSEKAISEANRTLVELDKKQGQTEVRLTQLSAERSRYQSAITEQQTRLIRLLHEQYASGNENRLKLLLSGDNPNRIQRDLQYMEYVSAAQTRMIESLRINLHAVEKNRVQTENTRRELEDIAQKKQAQKEVLEKEKAHRTTLLAQLSNKLDAQKKQASQLEQDEKRLGSLVDRLARAIAQQRKTPKPPRKRSTRKGTAGTESQPPEIVNAVPEPGVSDGQFAKQRGKLRLPVRGTITARYGSKRAEGPSWKGIFIRTAEGAEIRAVANGRVVFADTLRGFGNLIILDHGNQYMTIYGNAQSLHKKVGDSVKGSDIIARAGNSGNNEQIGLYFEMRHNGRAFNPLEWVTTR